MGIIIPDPDEVVELLRATKLKESAELMVDLVLHNSVQLTNDAARILGREPLTIKDWVHLNSHFFVQRS